MGLLAQQIALHGLWGAMTASKGLIQQFDRLARADAHGIGLIAEALLVDKCIRINAGVALVSECKKAGIDKGTPLEVTFKEKKGNLKIYSLTLLA